MRTRLAALLIAATVAATPLYAEDAAAAKSDFILVPNVRIWGADMTVGYRGVRIIPSLETVFWAHVGGGWEAHALYRDFATSPIIGLPYTPAKGEVSLADYQKLTFDWQVGLSQGILWSDRLDRNLLEGVLLAKWRIDKHYMKADGASSLILDSELPDRDGIFATSFLLALRYNGIKVLDKRQTRDGLYAETSAEWAPAGLFGSTADFVRLNEHVSGFVTLVDAAHLTLVGGDRLEGDLLLSPAGDLSTIPVSARTTLGGMNPDDFGGESGLGGAVRGIASERFDGTLKLVNNIDLRLFFPEIFPVAIFPGLVAYLDAGLVDYQELDRRWSLPDDLFISTGLGVVVRALVTNLVLYASYCLAPADAAGFKLDFRFNTQF